MSYVSRRPSKHAGRPLDMPSTNKMHQARKGGTTFNLPPSPTQSIVARHSINNLDTSSKGKGPLTQDLDRGTPGDAQFFSTNKAPRWNELSKKKSQFYDDAFACREPNSSARERVLRESVVMAEIRTNVIINDEYTFIADLSYNLSNRYQRPESCILVSVSHSACLLFGGSFDPAYIITITALPSQVQPITNKRNTMLLQRQLEESLGVSPSRGIIKFVGIVEENFAFNGKTVAGEIEELEREQTDELTEPIRSPSRGMGKANKKKQSMRSLKNLKISSGGGGKNLGSPTRTGSTSPMIDWDVPSSGKSEKSRNMGRRRSFIHGLFGRS